MMRAFLFAACMTILASEAKPNEAWEKLEPFTVDRFEISLPSGAGWSVKSGDRWYNVSKRIRTKEGALYIWVGFEVNSYPKNRYDWLAVEIAREVRDSEAIKLLKGQAESGNPLETLKYDESTHSDRTAYSLTWAHHVYVGALERDVPGYQELYVFLPDDHASDFQFMSIYFGVVCLADCTTDFPNAELLHPILGTVRIKAYE